MHNKNMEPYINGIKIKFRKRWPFKERKDFCARSTGNLKIPFKKVASSSEDAGDSRSIMLNFLTYTCKV